MTAQMVFGFPGDESVSESKDLASRSGFRDVNVAVPRLAVSGRDLKASERIRRGTEKHDYAG